MTDTNRDFAWRIGGAQGSGVDTAARMFSYASAFGGLHVFGRREYYSNIMGRHSYFDVRVAHHKLTSHREKIDLLATFDDETLARHYHAVLPGGAIIYAEGDADTDLERIRFLDTRWRNDLIADLEAKGLPVTTGGVLEDARQRGIHTFEFKYNEIMETLAEKMDIHKSVAERTLNTVAVAASIGLIGYDPDTLVQALNKNFPGREKIINLNVEAANLTYQFIRENLDTDKFKFHISTSEGSERRLLVNANQTNAMGKIAGGMTFQTYYPISPATDESVYLEGHANFPLTTGGDGSVVVVQTEDELAAATMAAGAALTGARSATATSGPGFSLMVEALGWAGINEVPMVFTLYQRGSPSTGMPTRTEQGDLLFAVHAGHGESPRIVMASGDVEEAFFDAAQAFNYAERYQTPVIHLLDKALTSTNQTVTPFDTSTIKIDRGERVSVPAETNGYTSFPRFTVTESGISPRPVLGDEGGEHWLTGGEHTVLGRVTEDPVVREAQMEKRARKLELAKEEIPDDEKFRVYGDEDAELTIMSWGQTKGAILEALDGLQEEGISARLVHVRLLWPFPTEELQPYLETANPLVITELNFSGQFASLLRENTGYQCDHLVVKYNGRPIPGHVMLDTLKEIAAGDAGERIVLRNPFE